MTQQEGSGISVEIVEVTATTPEGKRRIDVIGTKARIPAAVDAMRVAVSVALSDCDQPTVVRVEVVGPTAGVIHGQYEDRTLSPAACADRYTFDLRALPGDFHFLAAVQPDGDRARATLIVVGE